MSLHYVCYCIIILKLKSEYEITKVFRVQSKESHQARYAKKKLALLIIMNYFNVTSLANLLKSLHIPYITFVYITESREGVFLHSFYYFLKILLERYKTFLIETHVGTHNKFSNTIYESTMTMVFSKWYQVKRRINLV